MNDFNANCTQVTSLRHKNTGENQNKIRERNAKIKNVVCSLMKIEHWSLKRDFAWEFGKSSEREKWAPKEKFY